MSEIELVEVEPGKWRRKKEPLKHPRSDLALPYVISDIMPPTEQVDGRFYTSKREYRRVGRSHGLIEIGNEKLKPKQRATADPTAKKSRQAAIGKAISEYKAGRRV